MLNRTSLLLQVMHLHKSGVPIICKSHWDQQSGIISFSASNFDTHIGDFLPTPFAGQQQPLAVTGGRGNCFEVDRAVTSKALSCEESGTSLYSCCGT